MDYIDGAIEFPLSGLNIDIDYLDCSIANAFNNSETLSNENIDLDLDIENILNT